MGIGVLQLQGNTFLSTPSRFRCRLPWPAASTYGDAVVLEAQGLLRILVPNLDSEDGQYQSEKPQDP